MTRTKVHFCDFCNCTDPFMTWTVRPGSKPVDLYGIDVTTGKAVAEIHDEDGRWVACKECHEMVLGYKEAKLKDSALRRLIAFVAKRINWERKFRDLPGVLKVVKQQTAVMYADLLPKLHTFEPFEPFPDGEVRFTSKLHARMDQSTIVPPSHIPDGSSRGRF